MQLQLRIGAGAVIAAAALGALLWWWHAPGPAPVIDSRVSAAGVPVVMRTSGGLLEVATVRAVERFTRADTAQFWGIDLGTTVSIIQAPVTYRFHLELAREWTHTIRDKTCVVQAPALRPSLPVAFDTTGIEKYTRSGWARFNKQENLDALERSITPELNQRADSAAYRQLATEAARQTVREFVTQWLLREQAWRRDPSYRVIVLFPGEREPAPDQPAPDPSR
jgi:hypothetical protein